MVSCTIVVILGHTVPPQTLLIKTCEGVSFPAFWRANHDVLIATVQATFFNVNAKENERKRRKEDQQLSSGIKVYTEKSLNVGFEFMLIMIALLFHAKLCFIKKSTRSVLFDSTQFFSPKWFLLNREFDQTFRTILQPSLNGLIVAASGPLVCWRLSLLLMLIYNVKRRVSSYPSNPRPYITLHPPFIEVVGLWDLTGLISPQFQLRGLVSNKSVTFLLSDPR